MRHSNARNDSSCINPAPEGPLLRAQQMKVARNPKHSPDFTGAFQHICVHPGARMIIDKVSEARPVRASQRHQLQWSQMCLPSAEKDCVLIYFLPVTACPETQQEHCVSLMLCVRDRP